MATSLGADLFTQYAGAFGSPYLPGPQAVANSVPGWTGGMLPAPVVDPATGIPVIPAIPGLPAGTVVQTPGGTPAVTVPAGVVIPQVVPVPVPAMPSFWDSYGPAISAGLAIFGALTLTALAYNKYGNH